MKRIAVLIALVTTIAASALAQPAPPPPAGAGRPDILVQYLQLTPDQKIAWSDARKATAAVVQPLREKEKGLHEQLKAALDAATPDPAAIGNLMLSIRATAKDIKAAHQALEQKLTDVLTPEQKTKFDAFNAARAFIQQHRQRRPGPKP